MNRLPVLVESGLVLVWGYPICLAGAIAWMQPIARRLPGDYKVRIYSNPFYIAKFLATAEPNRYTPRHPWR